MTEPDYRKVPAYNKDGTTAGPTITLGMYGGTVAPNVRKLLSTPSNVALLRAAGKQACSSRYWTSASTPSIVRSMMSASLKV